MKSSAGSSRSISTSYLFLSHLTFTATDGIVLKRVASVDYSRVEKTASAERAGQRMQRAPPSRQHITLLGMALDTSFRARGGFLSERAAWSLRQAPCARTLFGRNLPPQRRRTQNDARMPNNACSGQFRSRPTHLSARLRDCPLSRVAKSSLGRVWCVRRAGRRTRRASARRTLSHAREASICNGGPASITRALAWASLTLRDARKDVGHLTFKKNTHEQL
jgi:hypothetical protein